MSDLFVKIADFEFANQADLMKHLLENEGFEVLLDHDALSNLNFLLNAAGGWPSIKVKEKDVELATQFVEKHRKAVAGTKKDLAPDVTFDCDECGKAITLPGKRRGGVDDCPHCKAYVDVPE